MPDLLIPAHHLRIGDIVHDTPNQTCRRVAGCRIQGARPEVVILWADSEKPSTYPAAEFLHIHRSADE